MTDWRVIQGDCLEVMRGMAAESVDSIVTDPPYGLSFMGRDWDHGVPGVPFWESALSVAKPGAHLLAFGGTRTFHRLACAIEDAGWEVRDCVMWVYGSGFPKSLDVSKAIDKAAGAEREVVGPTRRGAQAESTGRYGAWGDGITPTAPATDAARQWSGWGTALKPAWEPIIVARKPLSGTVAANVLRYGTGAINVDGCRVGTESTTTVRNGNSGAHGRYGVDARVFTRQNPPGRWPANLIHDGSDEVVAGFPQGSHNKPAMWRSDGAGADGTRAFGKGVGKRNAHTVRCAFGDSGSAARFFYVPKASKADRDEGLDGVVDGVGALRDGGRKSMPRKNIHPTVKPTALMRYLCRMVTPPGGLVLDPFCGSGSTGKGATLEGFDFTGIELNAGYASIAQARIDAVSRQGVMA